MYDDLDTYAIIDLDAIRHNIREIKNKFHNLDIMFVLKADAYGHKATEIYKLLLSEGADKFAVANLSEALELRKIDRTAEILVLGRIAPANIRTAIENEISMTVYSKECWENIFSRICHGDKNIRLHIKINTGFNRLGFNTDHDHDSVEAIKNMTECGMVSVESIYSHFALADYERDREQFDRFSSFIRELKGKGIKVPKMHMADSITAVDYPWARMDMVRIGALIYGLKADRESYKNFDLRYSMKLYSTVTQVRSISRGEGVSYDYFFKAEKDMKIAALAFGYADGYPRQLWKNGYVLINNKKAYFTGLMCMDQCMVDVTDIEGVKPGDKVCIYDADTDSEVSLASIAIMAGTNKNNIISSLSRRVPRVYLSDGKKYIINQLTGEEDFYEASNRHNGS